MERLKPKLESIYSKNYGYDLNKLKRKLKKMLPMKLASIPLTKKAIKLYNILPSQWYLIWVARFYLTLPIPSDWEEIDCDPSDLNKTEKYKNWFTNTIISVRPCYFYVNKLMEKAKRDLEGAKRIARIWMVGNEHVFEDGFQRVIMMKNFMLFEDARARKLRMIQYGMGMMFKNVTEGLFQRKIARKYENYEFSDPFVRKIEKYTKNPGKIKIGL